MATQRKAAKTDIYDLDTLLERDVLALQSALAKNEQARAVHVAALAKLDRDAALLVEKQAKAVATRGVRAPYAMVMQHLRKHVHLPGTFSAQQDLTAVEVAEVRAKLAQGVPGAQLAREYNTLPMTISRIKNNQTYKPR